jgi:hypothetical protein
MTKQDERRSLIAQFITDFLSVAITLPLGLWCIRYTAAKLAESYVKHGAFETAASVAVAVVLLLIVRATWVELRAWRRQRHEQRNKVPWAKVVRW